MPPARQLELLPLRRKTAEQRRAWIRERLQGLEYRQAAREARREQLNRRRRMRREGVLEEPEERQMTINEAIERTQSPESADLHQPVTTLPLFPDVFDEPR